MSEMSRVEVAHERRDEARRIVKCVVWDLDNTIWDGILLEDENVRPRAGIKEIIRTLDERGILQSVASRNDYDCAMAKLRELELAEYFLHPQIHFGSKTESLIAIARSLNIGEDAIGFVDDQAFERDEVQFSLPQTLCIDAADIDRMLDKPELTPRFVTEDSRIRRRMYISDLERKREEETYSGSPREFLASLNMHLVIAPAGEGDLERAEELTLRTNQLNTTGYTYSYDELDRFRRSPNHDLFIASLEDRYGTYGKIGLALVERGPEVYTCKLFLMSCRVMSRGVGSVFIGHLLRSARDAGVRLRAELIETGRNRAMYVAYKFAGFREVERLDNRILLESDTRELPPVPDYMKVEIRT